MSTAAEKKKAVMALVEATASIAAASQAEQYQLNKARKAAATLGVRAELDDFMRDTWGMTVRTQSKRKR